MMLLDGLHVPLATPFTRDGRLALHKLESNVRRYSLSPASALVALGPRGQGTSLSDAETRDALDAVSAAASPEKVLVAGIVRNSVAQALTVAALAERAGFDAVVVSAPPCWPDLVRNGGGPGEVLNFFRTIADNAPLPVVLSSDSVTPWLGLSLESVAALAEHGNIVGLYDADLNVARLSELKAATAGKQIEATVTTHFRPVTRRMLAQSGSGDGLVSAESLAGGPAVAKGPALKTRVKKLGFQILSAGDASRALDLLQGGASGFMPKLAAPAPQACHEVLAAFQDGDAALAALRAARLVSGDAVLAELGQAAVAYGCDRNGYFGGVPRLPVLPLAAAGRARVDVAMADLKS